MKLTELETEVVLNEEPGANWYRVFPAKALHLPNGEKIALDAGFFAGMVGSFQAKGLKVQVDFNHMSAGASHYSEGAAAGWVTEMEARVDGLYARIEWTNSGLTAIRAREYLYLSPEFELKYFDQNTGEVVERPRLLAVALTNRPYLEQQTALAASDSGITKEIHMDQKEIDLLRAEKAAAELAAAEAKAALDIVVQSQKDALLQAAVADGRVTPSLVPSLQSFSSLVGKDVKKFADFLAALPAAIRSEPVGQIQAPAQNSAPQVSLAEKAAGRVFGLSEADMAKYGDHRAIVFERGKKVLIMQDGRRVEV